MRYSTVKMKPKLRENLEYFLRGDAADDGLHGTDLTGGTRSELADETNVQFVDIRAQPGPQLFRYLHESINVRLHSHAQSLLMCAC